MAIAPTPFGLSYFPWYRWIELIALYKTYSIEHLSRRLSLAAMSQKPPDPKFASFRRRQKVRKKKNQRYLQSNTGFVFVVL